MEGYAFFNIVITTTIHKYFITPFCHFESPNFFSFVLVAHIYRELGYQRTIPARPHLPYSRLGNHQSRPCSNAAAVYITGLTDISPLRDVTCGPKTGSDIITRARQQRPWKSDTAKGRESPPELRRPINSATTHCGLLETRVRVFCLPVKVLTAHGFTQIGGQSGN